MTLDETTMNGWGAMCADARKSLKSDCPLFEDEVITEIDKLLNHLTCRVNDLESMKPHLLELKALAMNNTVKARIPECGDFGHIAQDLDYICNLLFGD
jgi:hypothetical protein